jgi:elongator complex protein 3
MHKKRNNLKALTQAIIDSYFAKTELTTPLLESLQNRFPSDTGYFSRTVIIDSVKQLMADSPDKQKLIDALRLKPIRTLSGVTPVTVLTKPFPCPGTCIFCPNDIRMPKSYLSQEPGAQRAEHNYFDPYLQTYNRLQAYRNMGHTTDKIEMIVLGGTWSFYPQDYRIWFITRIFEALNDFGDGIDQSETISPSIDLKKATKVTPHTSGSRIVYNPTVTHAYFDQEQRKRIQNPEQATWKDLQFQQERNITNATRCVGLTLETRPDYISEEEVIFLRRLGATKTQIGLQSLQDSVLTLNKRGHDVAASRRAMRLLRLAGFKIHAHWMPNLYGSSPEADKADFDRLYSDPDFMPDELKLYPCSLIEGTELMDVHNRGDWQAYDHETLLDVVSYCLAQAPQYTRLTRVVRDIPSQDIVTGNKFTNFRQMAEAHCKALGLPLNDIRSREIRKKTIQATDLSIQIIRYDTNVSQELFMQWVTPTNDIAAFLRLSFPTTTPFIEELKQRAIIRELHVYGQSLMLGFTNAEASQHTGLGKRLLHEAEQQAKAAGFEHIAVISAIGTIPYYEKMGYQRGVLYQHKALG